MSQPTRCQRCGGEIEWPPLDYGGDPPLASLGVLEGEIGSRVQRASDVCIIDGEKFLLRGNVQIPLLDRADHFAWGVWCSVSERSFVRIDELWESPAQLDEPPFFAWLLTLLPCYDVPTAPVKASLHMRGPCVAPYIEVDPAHPLGREQRHGITMERVWEFARTLVGDAPPRCPNPVCEAGPGEPPAP